MQSECKWHPGSMHVPLNQLVANAQLQAARQNSRKHIHKLFWVGSWLELGKFVSHDWILFSHREIRTPSVFKKEEPRWSRDKCVSTADDEQGSPAHSELTVFDGKTLRKIYPNNADR